MHNSISWSHTASNQKLDGVRKCGQIASACTPQVSCYCVLWYTIIDLGLSRQLEKSNFARICCIVYNWGDGVLERSKCTFFLCREWHQMTLRMRWVNSRPLITIWPLVQLILHTSLQEEVLFSTMGDSEKGGCYRLITLNRPKALNALNYNMIRLITADMKVCEILQHDQTDHSRYEGVWNICCVWCVTQWSSRGAWREQ